MQTTIYVPDITCESCTKIITKKFKTEQNITHWTFREDHVIVDHNESVTPERIISLVESAGFRASTEPIEYKTLKERMRHYRENTDTYEVEKKGIAYSIYVFLILFILEGIAYLGFLNTIPNFLQRFGIWIIYLNISIAAIGFAVYHLASYKTKISCMVGMMIGMTFGMQAGLLIGAILGATNGFFIGATTGMLIAVALGAIMGKCCGIMGIMEGMMAGVMGGTMGSMTSYMMLSDHVLIFMPIYILINIIIIGGLSYMFIQEAVDGKAPKRKPLDFMTYASAAIIVTAILIIIITYGPRSTLLGT